jgi:DNA-binding protein HU-beta
LQPILRFLRNNLKRNIMTKADLVNEVARETGVDKATIQGILDSAMSSIKKSIAEEEAVFLRGFGTFNFKVRKEKLARNISKNTTLVIDAHDIPAFKPAKSFVERMK